MAFRRSRRAAGRGNIAETMPVRMGDPECSLLRRATRRKDSGFSEKIESSPDGVFPPQPIDLQSAVKVELPLFAPPTLSHHYGLERLTQAVLGYRSSAVEELADVREFSCGTAPGDDIDFAGGTL